MGVGSTVQMGAVVGCGSQWKDEEGKKKNRGGRDHRPKVIKDDDMRENWFYLFIIKVIKMLADSKCPYPKTMRYGGL